MRRCIRIIVPALKSQLVDLAWSKMAAKVLLIEDDETFVNALRLAMRSPGEPLTDLADYRTEEITSTVINRWIDRKKKYYSSEEYGAKGRGCAGRCDLYDELNLFTTIFNWYKAEDEFGSESSDLFTPIRPWHMKMAFIREPTVKPEQKKITVETAFNFFSALPELYADLAMI
jgi:hypothetical protein